MRSTYISPKAHLIFPAEYEYRAVVVRRTRNSSTQSTLIQRLPYQQQQQWHQARTVKKGMKYWRGKQ